MMTFSQTLGAEALMKFIDPSEVIKRLAAAQGIDVLNLVKGPEQLQQEMQQQQQQQMQQSLMDQAGQLAGAPMMDPQKNPDAIPSLQAAVTGQAQTPPPPEEL